MAALAPLRLLLGLWLLIACSPVLGLDDADADPGLERKTIARVPDGYHVHSEFVFAPDLARFVAILRQGQVEPGAPAYRMLLDGELGDAHERLSDVTFNANGSSVAWCAFDGPTGGPWQATLFVDGKPSQTAKWIGPPTFVGKSRQVAYYFGDGPPTAATAAQYRGGKYQAVIGGKPIGPEFVTMLPPDRIVFDSRGRDFAVKIETKSGEGVLTSKGLGPCFDMVFSPVFDRKGRVAFALTTRGQWTHCINGKLGTKGYEAMGALAFHPKGSLVFGLRNQGKWILGIDNGIASSLEFDGIPDAPVFSADGKVTAFVGNRGGTYRSQRTPEWAYLPGERPVGGEWHVVVGESLGPAYDAIEGLVLDRKARPVYAASKEGRWFVVRGDDRSPEFHRVGAPQVQKDGSIVFGALDGQEIIKVTWRPDDSKK